VGTFIAQQLPSRPENSGDRCQADFYRHELDHQIKLLGEHVGTCRRRLAAYTQRGQLKQARLMQRELGRCAIELRSILEMLSSIDRRFPRDEINEDLRGAI
jgi:hypothetical protein